MSANLSTISVKAVLTVLHDILSEVSALFDGLMIIQPLLYLGILVVFLPLGCSLCERVSEDVGGTASQLQAMSSEVFSLLSILVVPVQRMSF